MGRRPRGRNGSDSALAARVLRHVMSYGARHACMKPPNDEIRSLISCKLVVDPIIIIIFFGWLVPTPVILYYLADRPTFM